jgi:hypothetical protein
MALVIKKRVRQKHRWSVSSQINNRLNPKKNNNVEASETEENRGQHETEKKDKPFDE